MNLTPRSVRISRTIRADAETLFRGWTDPEELSQWWRQDGEGWSFAHASIDLRVGGAYRLGMVGPDGRTHVAFGVYREILRPFRLVFTWDWEDPGSSVGETVVTVEFRNAGRDQTDVVITHEHFADSSRMGRHQQGWTEILGLLERFATGPSPRTLRREENG